MIFRPNFPDVEIPKIGLYQYITSNPYGIDDDKVIFIDGITDKKLTFGQFKSNSKRLAAGLVNKVGFKRGDVLALCSPNHLDYPVVMFSVIAAGGAVSTVNPAYTAEEFTYQLKDCGASFIIAHPECLRNAIEAATATNIPISKIFLFDDKEINGIQPFSSLISNQEINPIEYSPNEAKSTTVFLCYSAGTTGKSKGVETTHTNMVSAVSQTDVFDERITHETSFIGVLPFYHMYGLFFLLNLVILKGASCVILSKFKLETYCSIIQDYKINVALVVPPIISFMVRSPIARQYDLSSLQVTVSAAAHLSEKLIDDYIKIYKHPTKQGYGLTEASGVTHLARTDKVVNGSIGILVPNVECKIISENGQELGYNDPGELCVRGPCIMKGYLNNKKATDACIDSDSWLHTGDIAFADPQGNFFLIGRIKELIKYRGSQVAPAELESVLLTHSSIVDAAVIGIYSDEDATEYPVAFVVLRQNEIQSDQLKEEIRKFVSKRVAQHKRLRGGVYFIDQIPRSPAGKILRVILREKAKKEYKYTKERYLEKSKSKL